MYDPLRAGCFSASADESLTPASQPTLGGSPSDNPRMATAPRGAILVVDDAPTIAEIVGRYLERAGYSTRSVGDGRTALELARADPPDLVVLDLMLPGIGGLELLRRLRERERERVPVVILTAKDHPSERVTGLRLGADDYVVKPFSPAELVARVDAVLRRARPQPGREDSIVFDGLETPTGAGRSPTAARWPSRPASSSCCCSWLVTRAAPSRARS